MKKVLRNLFITVLSCLAAACAFAACSINNSGSINEDAGYGSGELRYGVWNWYDGVKIAYISEKDAPNGNINEKRVFPEFVGDTVGNYYMVVDFDIQATEDNDGLDTVDATVSIHPVSVISAKLQATNTANYTDTTVDGVQQIRATYTIPENADTVRDARLIIKIEPLQRSEAYINVTFSSEAGVKAVQTENIEQTLNLGFTDGLIYELLDEKYTIVGIGKAWGNTIAVPLYKDGKLVEAIGNLACGEGCGSKNGVTKSLEDTGRVFVWDYRYLFNEDETEIIFGCGAVIPPESVTKISEHAYAGCEAVEIVALTENIESVGKGAFHDCVNLRRFELSFANIENRSFYYIFDEDEPQSLKTVTITGASIPNSAFLLCKYIENIELSDTITSMGSYAFSDCSSLKSIALPRNINELNSGVFYNCSSLKDVYMSEVTTIGNSAFFNCSSLISVDTNYVTALGSGAFMGCSSLKYINIPSVTEIMYDTFNGCEALTSIGIPSTVKTIGRKAFYYCKGIKSLTIPEGVTTIEEDAFNGCEGLTEITLPKSLVNIGSNAFRNSVWGKITYNGTKAQWGNIARGREWNEGTSYTLYCTDGTMQKWES